MSHESPIPFGSDFIDFEFDSLRAAPPGVLLGCTFDDVPQSSRGPIFEDAFPLMTDAEIDDAVRAADEAGGMWDTCVQHIYNQGNEGSCTGNQETQGGNVLQAAQFGKQNTVLGSPISIYKRTGRSPGGGSSVGDNLREHKTRGILPLDTAHNREVMGEHFGHPMPATGFYTPFPAGWESTAKFLRIDESYEVTSSRGVCTAVCRYGPLGYGRSSHSILGVRIVKRNGVFYLVYVNSWGEWGDTLHGLQGFGYDSPSKYGSGASRYGCHVKRSHVEPPWMR